MADQRVADADFRNREVEVLKQHAEARQMTYAAECREHVAGMGLTIEESMRHNEHLMDKIRQMKEHRLRKQNMLIHEE